MAAGHPAKGLDQAFAAKLQISPSMWSQIKSSRPIGDKLARQIENHCGAPTGWLDEVHEEQPPQADAAEELFVAAARAAWRAATARGKRELRTWVRTLPGGDLGGVPLRHHLGDVGQERRHDVAGA